MVWATKCISCWVTQLVSNLNLKNSLSHLIPCDNKRPYIWMLKDLLKAAGLFLSTYDFWLPSDINSFMTEVPIIYKPVQGFSGQITEDQKLTKMLSFDPNCKTHICWEFPIFLGSMVYLKYFMKKINYSKMEIQNYWVLNLPKIAILLNCWQKQRF